MDHFDNALFQPVSIQNLILKNRFIRSATWEGLATDMGTVTPLLIEKTLEVIKGGIGLFITGHAYVSQEGQASFRQLGIYSDHLLPGLSKMVDQCHQEGGKIIIQLAHGGVNSDFRNQEFEGFGPSQYIKKNSEVIKAMSSEDIQNVVDSFVKGAQRAEQAGFDGVQLHAAHGYLLSQFLSPFYNKRQDNYGGSLFNRMRIIIEMIQSIKRTVKSGFPILIKINSQDFLEGGLTTEEMIQTISELQNHGLDAVELSGGTGQSKPALSPIRRVKIKNESDEGFYLEASKTLKSSIKIPVILVGGIRSINISKKIIKEKIADFISLSRPLICEPDLISKWESGVQNRAKCLNDNLCFGPAVKGEGILCVSKLKGRIKI